MRCLRLCEQPHRQHAQPGLPCDARDRGQGERPSLGYYRAEAEQHRCGKGETGTRDLVRIGYARGGRHHQNDSAYAEDNGDRFPGCRLLTQHWPREDARPDRQGIREHHRLRGRQPRKRFRGQGDKGAVVQHAEQQKPTPLGPRRQQVLAPDCSERKGHDAAGHAAAGTHGEGRQHLQQVFRLRPGQAPAACGEQQQRQALGPAAQEAARLCRLGTDCVGFHTILSRKADCRGATPVADRCCTDGCRAQLRVAPLLQSGAGSLPGGAGSTDVNTNLVGWRRRVGLQPEMKLAGGDSLRHHRPHYIDGVTLSD